MQKLTRLIRPSSASSAPPKMSCGPALDCQNVDFLDVSPQADLIYGGAVSSVRETSKAPTPVAGIRSVIGGDVAANPASARAASSSANWSSSLQTVLDQPPSSLPKRLILGGMFFCLAFGAWAWIGQIEEVGRAQGRLVPEGETFKIHPVDMGKIAIIGVKEGQAVKAGQGIVKFDTEIAEGEVERLQQLLSADQAELSEMQALIDRTRLEAQTRTKISNADAQAQEAAIAQVKDNAATTRAVLAQLQADAAAQKERRGRLEPLVKEGALSKERLFESEQALRDRQSSIIESQGELQRTVTESEQLQAGLAQKKAEGQAIQLEAAQQTQQLEVERNQLKAKIAETQNLLNRAKAQLKQSFLTAPVDGVVSSLNVRNIGEVVQPGQTVAEIAPHDAPLVLSAILPNQEAGFVKLGMPVQVKLDAYPYQDYGIVPGKVTSISPDAKRDERLGPVYQIEVALERKEVMANQQSIPFKAGQTANAEIVIRRRRIADILLAPFRQLQKGGINL